MAIKEITVKVPYKYVVSKNNKKMMLRGRRPALTKEYREGKEATYLLAKEQYSGDPIEGRVEITFRFFFPDNRWRDVFNYTQMLMDGLEGALYVNDAQIDIGHVFRMDKDKDNPRAEVTIKEIKDDHV